MGDAAPVQASTQLLIRGKYSGCLGMGKPLREDAAGAAFRSPTRASGWGLACRGREGRQPELVMRILKAIVIVMIMLIMLLIPNIDNGIYMFIEVLVIVVA